MTWASLFDRADAAEVRLEAIREALAERRREADDG
jgi:hypothetical protein